MMKRLWMWSLRAACAALMLTGVVVGQATNDAAVHFPAGETSVEVPFEILANVPYIQLRVNRRGPFLVGVDTGASGVALSRELQDAFAITISGTGTGGGAGSAGYTTGVVAGAVDLEFPGGLHVSSEAVRTMAFAGIWPLTARKIYGYIGYDVLRHFVVKFDYANRRMTLFAPEAFRPDGATALPFRMVGRNRSPQIDGSFAPAGAAPIAAPVNIDTGAGGIIVSGPLVKDNHLVERISTKLPSHSAGAGGGESHDWVARLGEIRIAGYRVPEPVAALSVDQVGALTLTPFVNVGGNLLRRFAMTIDYPGNKAYFEPNSHLNDAFPADASGMLIKAEGEDFRSFSVRDVMPGSPAAEAGLQVGDVITQVDGKPASGYTQFELMQLLTRAGERHKVTCKRGGHALKREIKLRKLL